MKKLQIEKQLKKHGTTMEAMERQAKAIEVNVELYIELWLKDQQGYEEYGEEDYNRMRYVEDLDVLEQE